MHVDLHLILALFRLEWKSANETEENQKTTQEPQ